MESKFSKWRYVNSKKCLTIDQAVSSLINHIKNDSDDFKMSLDQMKEFVVNYKREIFPTKTGFQLSIYSLFDDIRKYLKIEKKEDWEDRITERDLKINDLKIEQKILNLLVGHTKYKKNKEYLEEESNIIQYRIEDLTKEIYQLQTGEDIDNDRMNEEDLDLSEVIKF
jgi:hypothetical protein